MQLIPTCMLKQLRDRAAEWLGSLTHPTTPWNPTFCRKLHISLHNTSWGSQFIFFLNQVRTRGSRHWLYPSFHRLHNKLNCPRVWKQGNPWMQNPLYVRDILSGDLEKAFSTYWHGCCYDSFGGDTSTEIGKSLLQGQYQPFRVIF